MSRLKLYWPDGPGISRGLLAEEIESAVIPFARITGRFQGADLMDPVSRARVIHTNRRCPLCRHPVTEPIELNDAMRNRNNRPIPGTATLVGFRCDRCESEWPA